MEVPLARQQRISFLAIVVAFAAIAASACAPKRSGFYGGLGPDEDGVISTTVGGEKDEKQKVEDPPTEGKPAEEKPSEERPAKLGADLSERESQLIKTYLSGKSEKLSFLVVNAETKAYARDHLGGDLRILASVTKLATAVAALKNVEGISVASVSTMLKTSHNGLASKYVRLAAKSIDGTEVAGDPFASSHSCPGNTSAEAPAAKTVLGWYQRGITAFDWTGSALLDGAGCNYGNKMTSKQILKLLEFADSYGKAFGGKDFADLLSISGIEGTWAGRNTDDKGMIFAKTGTLGVASNLAGYFFVKRAGQLNKYYFAVFVDKTGGASSARARQLIESLVRHWIDELSAQEIVVAGNL